MWLYGDKLQLTLGRLEERLANYYAAMTIYEKIPAVKDSHTSQEQFKIWRKGLLDSETLVGRDD